MTMNTSKIIRYPEIAEFVAAQVYATMTGDLTPTHDDMRNTEYLKAWRINHVTLPFTWNSEVRVGYMHKGEMYVIYKEEFAPHAGNDDVARALLQREVIEEMAARVKLIGFYEVPIYPFDNTTTTNTYNPNDWDGGTI